jgi:Mg2+ and Co2+ transporter CorA
MLIAGIWGMKVGGIPFSASPNGFWVVGGLIAAVFGLVAIVLSGSGSSEVAHR